MVSHLKKLMESRAIEMNHPCLFDDTNIRSLFGILDISNHGYINYEQYKRGNLPGKLIISFELSKLMLSLIRVFVSIKALNFINATTFLQYTNSMLIFAEMTSIIS
jgi:hypothetical protein